MYQLVLVDDILDETIETVVEQGIDTFTNALKAKYKILSTYSATSAGIEIRYVQKDDTIH